MADENKYHARDLLKLENQFCFALYAASREVVKRYRPYLEPLGLTYTQYLVMLALWEHGVCSVKALGERLYLDSGTLTPVLRSMEAKGLVHRRRSTEDERVLLVEATEQGRKLRERAVDIAGRLNDCLRLPPDEAGELSERLRRLLAVIG